MDSIDYLLDCLTAQMARQQNEPIAQIRPIMRALLDSLLREYRAVGEPDGPTPDGFAIWLLWRLRTVKAA